MAKPKVGALTALAAVAALAGCGSSSGSSSGTLALSSQTVDNQQIEQGIEKSLSVNGATVTKASCPSNVPKQVGGTFTCDVTFSNGATGKVTVTQKSANHYTYTLKEGSVQIPGSVVDQEIEQQLAAQGVSGATVTCPQNIIVNVGTTVTCNIPGASGYAGGKVTFTFSNAEGSIDTSSVEPAS
jgi:hypothetical protein